MKKYDVIIVGGGPAGIAAAKILKNNNVNFCVIEKYKFPRNKLCGGALSYKSQKLLEKLNLSFDNCNSCKCKEARLVSSDIDTYSKLPHEVMMIDRYEFDYNNIKQVVDGNLFELETVESIDGNILKTNKEEYEFKYIIFADGVNGYSRKLIKNRKFGFCVECDCEVETENTILDFCAIDEGYGWIFSKVNHTTIGIGNHNRKKVDYIKLLIDFANKYGFKIDPKKIRGFHIPIFSKQIFKQSVIDNKYILVGDSAALVDAVSGEGIYYALLSGTKAAESIIMCLNSNADLKKTYFKSSKNLCQTLGKRKFASAILYSKHGKFFIKLGSRSKFIMKYVKRAFG